MECFRLISAVIKKDYATVRRLIEANVDVNAKYNYNSKETVLHLAIRTGYLPIIQVLLEYGADISVKNAGGLSPLHYGIFYHKEENTDIYKLLLENRANCNDNDAVGDTPFRYVLRENSLNTVKLMLEYGADITVINRNRETALHFAVQNKQHMNVLEFMLDRRLDIEASDIRDYSALHYAAQFANIEGCKLLLNRGALVRKSNVTDETPLSLIIKNQAVRHRCMRELIQIVELLIEYGANAADKVRGKSILQIAETQGSDEEFPPDVCVLIRHMAKMQSLHCSVNEEDRRLIENNKYYKEYYNKCVQEIEV